VPARGGELERAPGALLPADVGEIQRRGRAVAVRCNRWLGFQLELAAQVGGCLGEVPDRNRCDSGERGLTGRVGGTQETLGPEPPRTLRHREHAADSP
jgi:hypothetical protein